MSTSVVMCAWVAVQLHDSASPGLISTGQEGFQEDPLRGIEYHDVRVGVCITADWKLELSTAKRETVHSPSVWSEI